MKKSGGEREERWTVRDEGGMERGGRVGEWEGESESESGREVGLGGKGEETRERMLAASGLSKS